MLEPFRLAAGWAVTRRQLQRTTEWVLPFEAQNLRFARRELTAYPELQRYAGDVIREVKKALEIVVSRQQASDLHGELWNVGLAMRDYRVAIQTMRMNVATIEQAGKGLRFAQSFNITALPLQTRNRMIFSCEAAEKARNALIVHLASAMGTVGWEHFPMQARETVERYRKANTRRGASRPYNAFQR